MLFYIFPLRKRLSSFPFFLSMALCALVMFALAEVSLAATKSLLLTPVRAIFTDRQRSVDIRISNTSEEPITYAISLVTMRKDKNGQLREVQTETEEERLVKSMIRYSPRRATIAPGQRQVVKLMVQKPQDLPPGEYQTRMSFSPLADSPQKQQDQVGVPSGKASFNINFLVTSTIPVIIQNGDIAPDVTPLGFSLQQNAKTAESLAAEVKIGRSGKGSAFGNVRLDYIPANNPKAARKIGLLEGMTIYIPDTEQTFTIPLTGVTRQELSSGSVRVSFLPHAGSNGKQQKAAPENIKDFPLR